MQPPYQLGRLFLYIGLVCIVFVITFLCIGGSFQPGPFKERQAVQFASNLQTATSGASASSPPTNGAESSERKKKRVDLENPFQQRLLQGAVLLETRSRRTGDGPGQPDELQLWKTGFKYPLIKEEIWKAADHRQPSRHVFSVADHMMVKFPPDISDVQIQLWAAKHSFYVRQSLRTTRVKLIATPVVALNAAELILEAFRADFPEAKEPSVAVVENDYLVFPTLVPDDSSFSSLWGLHNTGQTGGVADADIDAPEAWDVTTGSREVLVGVIDTGIDRTHPDLVSNLWINPREIAGNNLDDDGNGFVDDIHGWDFFANDRDPTDEDDHGTHCAGTIGAVGNNRAGVTGVCWQVSMVGIRFIGPGGGSTSDAIECVNYATSLGVDLTSNSWGGGGSSNLLREAIENAGSHEILFVTAAGNDGTDNEAAPHYPASYPSENIISVASSTASDTRSDFSNYGRISVDLAAPGSAVFSTIPGPSYMSLSGTSMATPHVTGTLALAKSIAPQIGTAPLKRALLDTVDRLPSFSAITSSGGRLNAARLIESIAGPYPLLTVTDVREMAGGNGDGIQNPGETLAVHFAVANRGTQTASNVVVRLTSSAGSASRYSITQGILNVGTLAAGQAATGTGPFIVESSSGVQTPYDEEMIVTLGYGTPEELRIQRFNLRLYTSSQVTGQVTDVENGDGVPNAAVTFSGSSAISVLTGQDGRYSTVLTDGTYQVNARAPGYLVSSNEQITAPPGASGLNFVLSSPQLKLTPEIIVQDVRRGDIEQRVIRMSNHGSAPLDWRLQARTSGGPGYDSLKAIQWTRKGTPDQESASVAQNVQLPAVEVSMSGLTGLTVGAIATSWDRSILLNDLRDRGATIVTLTPPFSENVFHSVDAVLVDDSLVELSITDIQRLRLAVTKGTGLLCEADNEESLPKAKLLLAETGIQPVYETFRDLTLTDILSHPITVGVSQLREVAVGWSASLSGQAEPLVREISGRAHAAVSRLGRGVVVFVGNEITNSGNYATGDGRRFANQIVEGLVAGPEWLSVDSINGILAPGQSHEMVVSLDGRNVAAGDHRAVLVISSNVPDEPDLNVPVTMSVIEVPSLTLNLPAINFGDVIERAPATAELKLSNAGSSDLILEDCVFSGTGASAFLAVAENKVVPPGTETTVKVIFREGASLGRHEATLSILSNDPRNPHMDLPVTGTRVDAPDVVVSPLISQFNLAQGQSTLKTFTVKNTGKGVLHVSAELVFGKGLGWAEFDGASVLSLPKGKSGKITVRFKAGTLLPLTFNALLRVRTDDPDTPVIDRVLLMSVLGAPVPLFSEGGLQFSKTYVGQTQKQTLVIRNGGGVTLTIQRALTLGKTFRFSGALPMTIRPGESREFSVTFAPSVSGQLKGSLLFSANVPGMFFFVPLSGTAARLPAVRVSPASLVLSTAPGVPLTRSIEVANAGGEPLIWHPTLSAADASWISTPSLSARILGAGAQDKLRLDFSTGQMPAGIYRSAVSLTTNDPKRPEVVVPIAVKVLSRAVLEANPAALALGDIWKGTSCAVSFELTNVGNLPVEILAVTSSSKDMTVAFSGGRFLEPGDSMPIEASFRPSKVQSFKGSLTLKTRGIVTGALKLSVTANVIEPPTMELRPSALNVTETAGIIKEHEVLVYNAGGAPLNWQAEVASGVGVPSTAGTLSQVLQRMDARHAALASLIPSRYDFTEGLSGYSIVDGSGNMYDTGNLFSTNLNGGQAVPYANGNITSDVNLGASSRYFTRKQPGLFFLAADLVGPSTFRIKGGLGADGAGQASGAVLRRHGYTGFLKRVSGADSPSVNHLVILPDSPGLGHNFPSNTDLDDHDITGLPAATRLYVLVFATAAGGVVSDGQAAQIMDYFLSNIAHDVGTPWLQLGTVEGTSEKKSFSSLKIQTDTRSLPAGIKTARIKISSNSPASSSFELPVNLTVPSAPLLTLNPLEIHMPDTPVHGTSTQTLTLKNTGNSPLSVEGLSSSDSSFQILGATFPLTLSAGQSKMVQVAFSPLSKQSYRGQIAFDSNSYATGGNSLAVSGSGVAAPLMQVTPESITLTTRPGVPVSQVITLKNIGEARLDWSLSKNLTTGILTPLTGSLEPGESSLVTLTSVSNSTTPPGLSVQGITLSSNDPLNPAKALSYSRIIQAEPVLTVTPAPVAFGNLTLPGIVDRTITLKNTGNATLVVSAVRLPSSRLTLLSTSLPILVSPNATRAIDVRFAPSDEEILTGNLEFDTNHPHSPLVTVPVSGTAASPPRMAVAPSAVNVSIEDGRRFSTALTIRNDGGAMLTWNAEVVPAEAAAWLSLDHAGGAATAGGISYLGMNLTASSLSPVTRTASIRLTSNAPINGSVVVPVDLRVIPAELSVSAVSIQSSALQGQVQPDSSFQIHTRPGESPTWTLVPNVPWITPSVTAGSGPADITLSYSTDLAEGVYTGKVIVSSALVTRVIDITREILPARYSLLQTDRRHNRLLGVVRGTAGKSSALVTLDPQSLKTQAVILLPTDITGMDLSTDERTLYAISFAGRSITRVDLDSLSVVTTREIAVTTMTGSYFQVQAGREGIVYYTDAASNPVLHVFDFAAGRDLSTFSLQGFAGIGDFTLTPDARTLYARSLTGTGSPGTSFIARVDCSTDTLVQTAASSPVLIRDGLRHPVLLSVNLDSVITQERFFSTANLMGGIQGRLTDQRIYNASAYFDVLVTDSQILSADDGRVLNNLPFSTTVTAFSPDQKKLVCSDPANGDLVSVNLDYLPEIMIEPGIMDGSVLNKSFNTLSWTGDSAVAAYDVYLGTDELAVRDAVFARSPEFLYSLAATSTGSGLGALSQGQVYYWRIDGRSPDGTVARGPVWKFKIAGACTSPDRLSAYAMAGDVLPRQVNLSITTDASDLSWILSSDAAWLDLSQTTGVGNQTVVVSMNPALIPVGGTEAIITLKSGTDLVRVPVKFDVLGELKITKMKEDPSLPVVYALHRESVSPYQSWLLWVDPVTAEMDHGLLIGNSAVDFTIHPGDDALYVLVDNGRRVLKVRRQGIREIDQSYLLPAPQAGLYASDSGRLVTLSESNGLQLRQSATGAAIGSMVQVLGNHAQGVMHYGNSALYVAVTEGSSNTGIVRYALTANGISFVTANYFPGIIEPPLLLSGDGQRLVYAGKVYAANTLNQLSGLGQIMHAVSADASLVVSDSAVYSAGAPSIPREVLPFTTSLMALMPDGSRLLLYSPATHSFRSFVMPSN